MNARFIGVVALCALVMSGCNNQSGLDAAAHTATGQMERSAAIGALVHNYDQARAAQQWDLALTYAAQLQHLAPNSALASSVQATLADTNIRADEVKDRRNLAALWSYNVTAATGDASDGVLVSASIASDNKADASDTAPVRLVLRQQPKWGRSLNLILDHGQFDCASDCKVQVQFDDQPARSFAATKSDQNKQTLTIDDEKTIREILDKVRVITVDTGFDRVQLERQLQ